MNVQLYVYDLSQGLARQLSASFLGTHIDAVYHTSLVFGGIEYFYGLGVQTSYPGRTHHGAPMEIVQLGKTELPVDVILEYLESLKEVYTAESYDLFLHNCNNFTNDFANFLVGRGIPAHITSLPQTVLNTPFGQMLKPRLDQMMRPITQASTPASSRPMKPATADTNASRSQSASGSVAQNDLRKSGARASIILSSENVAPPPFANTPPLDKLTAKLDRSVASDPAVLGFVSFLSKRNPAQPQELPVPDLRSFASVITGAVTRWQDEKRLRHETSETSTQTPGLEDNMKEVSDVPDHLFPLLDLLRAALPDPRIATFFASPSEPSDGSSSTSLIGTLISPLPDQVSSMSPATHLTLIRLCCNVLSTTTPAATRYRLSHTCPAFVAAAVQLSASTLTQQESADRSPIKSRLLDAAAKLAWAIAGTAQLASKEAHGRNNDVSGPSTTDTDSLPTQEQRLELLAAVVQALGEAVEETTELATRMALVRALGLLILGTSTDGEERELCRVLDVQETMKKLEDRTEARKERRIIEEVKGLLAE